MDQHFPAPYLRPAEAGYTLVAAMFLLFTFTIALSVAAPAIGRQIQRDRERETIERGKQYQRAIQLYYRKFRAFPPTIDALIDTNSIRFLRKHYVDPMARKDDWRPILFGQNKAPAAMGFFGQTLNGMGSGASTLAGIGPSGGTGLGPSSPDSSSSVFNSGSGFSMGSSLFATTSSSGNSGAPGFGPGTQGSSSGAGSVSSGQSFGGAGIIGVSPAVSGTSITVFKQKSRFNEWEFTYDPVTDVALMRDGAVLTQPSAGSLVGNGSGPNGTGPIVNPNSNPQGASNPPQQ